MGATYRRMTRRRRPDEKGPVRSDRSLERASASLAVGVVGAPIGAEAEGRNLASLQRTAGNRSVVQMLASPDSYKQVAKGPDPKVDIPEQRGRKRGGPKRKDGAGPRRNEGGTKEKSLWSRLFGSGPKPQGNQTTQPPQTTQDVTPPSTTQTAPPQTTPPQTAPTPVRPTDPAATRVVRQAPGPNTKKTAKGAWGCVDTETVEPTLTATLIGDKWHVDATAFQGNYGKIVSLIKGCTEVTRADPDDDISSDQIFDLWRLGDYKGKWYMLGAVEAHESVHETRIDPALSAVATQLQTEFAKLEVKKSKTVNDVNSAIAAVKASGKYKQTCKRAREIWDAKYVQLIRDDHNVLTPNAEHSVVNPMIRQLNQERVANGLAEWWPEGWTG